MNTLLLLLTDALFTEIWPDGDVIWCSLGEASPSPEHLALPGSMAPLCRALYAAEHYSGANHIIVSTILPLPKALRSGHLPTCTTTYLTGPDEGALFFPSANLFRQCARDAIRTHNPEQGPITLESAWQQHLLSSYEIEV